MASSVQHWREAWPRWLVHFEDLVGPVLLQDVEDELLVGGNAHHREQKIEASFGALLGLTLVDVLLLVRLEVGLRGYVVVDGLEVHAEEAALQEAEGQLFQLR